MTQEVVFGLTVLLSLTSWQMDMDDGDEIDAMVHQTGGY